MCGHFSKAIKPRSDSVSRVKHGRTSDHNFWRLQPKSAHESWWKLIKFAAYLAMPTVLSQSAEVVLTSKSVKRASWIKLKVLSWSFVAQGDSGSSTFALRCAIRAWRRDPCMMTSSGRACRCMWDMRWGYEKESRTAWEGPMGPLGASWRIVESVSTESRESADWCENYRTSNHIQSQCMQEDIVNKERYEASCL